MNPLLQLFGVLILSVPTVLSVVVLVVLVRGMRGLQNELGALRTEISRDRGENNNQVS
ncbi:hypothetical protein [Luethyella okanaganae]|uniref:Uncharacterized protein n=1 Tax=Luethyella okanaganae TaxID=69372 RepID=A0ABW1VFF0_9MICO